MSIEDLQAMAARTNGELIALKRQQEMISELVRISELGASLGCGVAILVQQQGLAKRVVLDIAMDAPGHPLPDVMVSVDELFARDNAGRPEPMPAAPPEPDTPDARAAGAPWTEAEDAEAVRLKLAGLTVAEIAARLDRPVPGTQFRLAKKLRPQVEAARAVAARDRGKAAKPAPGAPAGGYPLHAPDGAGDDAPAETSDNDDDAPASMPAPSLPVSQRLLRAALEEIDDTPPFTPDVDLALMEALSRGDGIANASEALAIAPAALRARVALLKGVIGLHPGDAFSVEEQARLLTQLRARASLSRESA